MLSNHLILCCPLLLLPSVFPRTRVFSNDSVLHIRWPKYWSFIISISSSNEYLGLICLGSTCLTSLKFKGLSRVFSSTTIQEHQFVSTQPSLWLLYSSLSFLKKKNSLKQLLEFFTGKTSVYLWSVSEKLLWYFGSFMSLEVFHCSLCIWSSTHFSSFTNCFWKRNAFC